MNFDKWFDQQNLEKHLYLDLESAFRSIAEAAWINAFDLGEQVACEGAYQDGYDQGYRDATVEAEDKIETAYKDGRSDGYNEGAKYKREDFV